MDTQIKIPQGRTKENTTVQPATNTQLNLILSKLVNLGAFQIVKCIFFQNS